MKLTYLSIMFNVFFLLNQIDGIAFSQTKINEARLIDRANQAYNYLKERKFDNFIKILSNDESLETRKEIAIEAYKVFPVIIEYKLNKIEICGEKAKTKMAVDLKIGEKVINQTHFDYWIFQNGDWYINEFGKMW